MADVRLTATNPEDSSVVPVACNEKGELKLEEIPDQSFDGNLDGDLSVTGQIATSSRGAYGVIANNSDYSSANLWKASVSAQNFASGGPVWAGLAHNFTANNSYVTSSIFEDGSVSFASQQFRVAGSGETTIDSPALAAASSLFSCKSALNSGNVVAAIKADGSVTFAGNKAGFTGDGYLWCTTRRGDTVILDATSNGLASWMEYTPPSRRDDLVHQGEELLEQWSEKNVLRPKPEDSSQD